MSASSVIAIVSIVAGASVTMMAGGFNIAALAWRSDKIDY